MIMLLRVLSEIPFRLIELPFLNFISAFLKFQIFSTVISVSFPQFI